MRPIHLPRLRHRIRWSASLSAMSRERQTQRQTRANREQPHLVRFPRAHACHLSVADFLFHADHRAHGALRDDSPLECTAQRDWAGQMALRSRSGAGGDANRRVDHVVCRALDMKRVERLYQRLPGNRLVSFGTRSSLWLAPDYPLSLERTVASERYRRFYLRDIEAVVIRRTPRRGAFNFVCFILIV